MPNGDQSGYVTVIRLLEYYGPREWVEKVLQSSQVPLQGQKTMASGAYIRSGLVQWIVEKPATPPKETQ